MKPNDVKNLVESVGGEVTDMLLTGDGHGCAVASFPLPKDHWLTANPDAFNVPPMPFRLGKGPDRDVWEDRLRQAGRFAVRATTRNGQDDDFDPDALVQNLIVGMLGYHTADGLSQDAWANPPATEGFDANPKRT